MADEEKRVVTCCFISDQKAPCEKPAEWEVWDGPTTDDYTHGCSDHVGYLLQTGRISTVHPVEAA